MGLISATPTIAATALLCQLAESNLAGCRMKNPLPPMQIHCVLADAYQADYVLI